MHARTHTHAHTVLLPSCFCVFGPPLGDGYAESEGSGDGVAVEAEENVAVETVTTVRRHDSLKAKKRAALAALAAQKRLQTANDTTADRRSVVLLKYTERTTRRDISRTGLEPSPNVA